ncbi:MAG: hypothetical protein MSIBF_02695 [Candidatus Altiarchaeales archaeon IMC4]|nr:MAG: hypothetical protein MSIBF_02695 [Candidatus Altiarchaeales archaeon IMC4]
MAEKRIQKWFPYIAIFLIVVAFLYLNHKIDNLDLIKEEKIVMTNNFSEIVEKVKPAVVWIIAETELTNVPFMGGEYLVQDNKVVSSGTGFFVSEDGYILTAEHVVHEAKDKIIVSVFDGNNFKQYNATTISIDNNADVALIKVEGKNFQYLELAEKEELTDGMDIGFIGYPLEFRYPLTHKGVLSGRCLYKHTGKEESVNVFMINAFVNRGNSGGPLFSGVDGKVIGVINARANHIDERRFIKLPSDYSPIATFGGVDPIRLSVETYNENLRYIGEVSQVGIGFSSSIDYGKGLLKAAR